jgi:pSer/pThr/pTyr-binding forkhead associated (FHA) protein
MTDGERLGPDREGSDASLPYVWFHASDGQPQAVRLTASRHTIGRGAGNDIVIDWDPLVSRINAQLERIGDVWTITDDGVSRNGTFVNGERLSGRRRLQDGDQVRVGQTVLTYRHTTNVPSAMTAVADEQLMRSSVSETQRRVLTALCRPYKGNSSYATPATNQQIADELFLSVDAVKTHLRTLFRKFGVEELPQNQKRARLVELSFKNGIVVERDL